MKRIFNLILTLAAMLTMAQTAWAGTTIETRTVTWKMDGGLSGQTTQITTGTLYTTVDGANQSMVYTNNENQGFNLLHFGDFGITETNGNLSTNNGYISFPGIKGTVTKVEMVNFSFARTGLQMYVGKDRSNTSTLLHLQGNDSDFDFAADNSEDSRNKSATFVGSVAVDESTPLKIMFAQTSGGEILSTTFSFNKGYIKVTYDAEVETTDDPGHDFTSITTSGNTLTATCTQSDPYHKCGLTNRQAMLTLSIDDAPYDFVNHTASLNMQEFTSSTSLAVSSVSIVYTNKVTGVERTQGEYEIGSYTATATVTIGGTEYTLNKDFDIYNGTIACDYPQFSFSPIPAIAGNNVTITFTPIAGEGVETLTLTGDKTNMSIGNGITDNHDGTYTFNMVSESLTLDATFSEPDASHFEQTGTDEYTIKTANGWNWFCYALNSGLAPDGFSGKTVKLGTSIESSEMAGMSGHPFKGTFDGQGNTLTFNLQASKGHSAPFHYTDGATISNLHVEGTITGGDNTSLGGLVGYAVGNITIENCHVSTKISTTHSGAAWHGGVIAQWNGTNATCTVTGCVYDGLIYNPDEAGVTTSCRGFIGWDYGNNGTITFTDCLSAPAAYGTGKYALGDNCFTFVYPNSEPTLTYNMTNCYYTSILGNRQGRPAATATVAPANLGNATTDHGMVDGYENGFLYNGNYYTPKYGDAVVEYRFNDWNERADVTINGTGNNLVGVNITEEVGNIKSVTYNRPFNTAQAATVILPFNYTCNGSEGGKFYSFAGFNGTTPIMEDGNQVTSLTANTPYLFVPTASTMTFPNITNMTNGIMTLQPTTGDYDATSDDGVWKLVGSYNGKTWEENDPEIGKAYVYNANGELFPVTAGTRIRPTECYIIQTKKLMTGTDITVSIPSVEWTGSEIAFDETAVVVKDGETTLTLTTDYTVTAPTGTLQDTGDYPVTITGAGEYAGEVVAMFTIKGKPVTVKNDKNEDVPAATGDAEITQDQDGLTLTLTTPTESTTPHTVNVPQPVEVDHVSIDRTFEAGKACTLYLPFSIAADKIAGGTFNTFTGVDTSNPTEWIVLYSPVAGDIEANTPYIFLPNGTNGGKITVNNGSDKVSICTANPHTTEKDQWDFIGTYERIKWTHNTSDPEYDSYREAEIGSIYGFAAEEKSGATVGQFVQVTDNVWINPMRAYLKHTVVAPARSMDGNAATTELPSSMKVVIVEGTTGITSMEDVRGKMSDAWYSLDGRKLQGKPTTKGMYIHNGRKEVVK